MMKYKFRSFLPLLILSIFLSACGINAPNEASTEISGDTIASEDLFGQGDVNPAEEAEVIAPVVEPEPEPEPEPTTCRIRMVGDMLASNTTNKGALYEDGTYNYDHIFANVLDEIAAADLAIINEEVMLGGTELGISGYPLFNSPYELGDAIAKAGFDVVLLASNHTIDKGETGFDNCINFWKDTYPEIGIVGVNQTPEDCENIYLYQKDDITIAILNFTFSLNGLQMPESRQYMVNLLDDTERLTGDLQKARELADYVIVCPHWGVEYVHYATDYQKNMAQLMADHGADLILGTHPHVIEPIEWITGVNGNQTLVYYSLGNFSSTQAYAPRMLGAMSDVVITKEDGVTSVTYYGVIPLINHYRTGIGELTTYPLSEYTEELAADNRMVSKDPSNWSLRKMQDLCENVFGDLYLHPDEIATEAPMTEETQSEEIMPEAPSTE